MNPILVVARQEFLSTVRKRSFIILVVGLPLVAAAVVAFLNLTGRGTQPTAVFQAPEAPTTAEGYVDHAGIIESIPEPLAGAYIAYPTEDEARSAAKSGRISGYYVIHSDYLESGEITLFQREFNPIRAEGASRAFRYLVLLNLTGDPELTSLLWDPSSMQEVTLEAREEAQTEGMASFWLPYGILMILFMSLSMSSGWLLQSVTVEKDTRMLEVMLSSISPAQMLVGKTLALGGAGLLQVAVWLLSGSLMLSLGGAGLNLPAGFEIGAGVIIWGAVFFLLGYALYASLIAGLGALAPSLRDASQATFLIYLPLLVPLWFISAIANQPNGPLAVAFSLFPFTAPVVMATRLVRVSPPIWQLALAVGLLLATAYGTTRLAAQLFRAQTLLSGQPLSLANLKTALRRD